MMTLKRMSVPLLVAVTAVLISASSLWATSGALAPPFRFSQTLYLAKQADVCPNDLLEWQVTTIIERVPAQVDVKHTVWSVQLNKTLIPAVPHDTRGYIWTDRVTVTSAVSFTVPLIPPGPYELRVAGQEANSLPSVYRVPFVIRHDCAVFKEAGVRTWLSKMFWPSPLLSGMLINFVNARQRGEGSQNLTRNWELIPKNEPPNTRSSQVLLFESNVPIFTRLQP